MLFRPENRSCFKHPVENANHHLFVKLRALCQHRRMMKIVQTENVRSALCSAGSDLRRMDFRKVLAVQEIPERTGDGLLDPEFCPLPQVSKGNRPGIEQSFQGSVHFPLADWKGHWLHRL